MTPRVLLVDDSAVFRAWVADAAKAEGWDLDVAETADEGLRRAKEDAPDVVLLDFVLPDGDGLEVLRALRDHGVEAPVVVLSGAESPEVAVRFIRAGAVDFLSKKDLRPARLAQAVRRALLLASVQIFEATAGGEGEDPRAEAEDDAEPPTDGAGRVALVVDDTATSRRALAGLLMAHGWRVEEAADAAGALRAALAHPPAVVFLDHLLPDATGYDVLARLRERRVDAPVIVLTGHGDEPTAESYLRRGAADFLPKGSVTGSHLLAAITRAMRLGGAQVRLREP